MMASTTSRSNVAVVDVFEKEGGGHGNNGHVPALPDATKRSLRIWNTVAAVVQLITSLACFGLTRARQLDKPWPIVGTFTKEFSRNRAELVAKGLQFGLPEAKKVTDVHVGYMSGLFLLLSFLNHALCAAPISNEHYNRMIAGGANYWRWIEYSFSASLMHVMIGILCGIADVHTLFLIFGLTHVTMIYGATFERDNAGRFGMGPRVAWLHFWLGFIPHAFNWLVIACHFFRNVRVGSPPGFVWAIIFIEFILDLSFAVNLWLQWKGVGRYREYAFGELMFTVLSLSAKQLLAWIAFGGANV
eukprot:tig00022104_g23814.t1